MCTFMSFFVSVPFSSPNIQATVAFKNTSRISLRPFFSANNNPSKTLDCWGLNIPLAILVSAFAPVKSAVGTSPFTVRCDNTTGILCFAPMSLIAEANSVETPPAPSPAIYLNISPALLEIFGSQKRGQVTYHDTLGSIFHRTVNRINLHILIGI